MAHKVFISYAAEDKAIADAVCNALEARGVRCWYAPRDVTYGKDFDEVIVDAICDSRLMILILSSHSNSSAHVKREIQNACMDDSTVPVLPFRVEDIPLNKALRYYLGAVHWLDALTPPLESHLNNLVQHVEARLPRTAPLPKLSEAEVPATPSPVVSKPAMPAVVAPVTKTVQLAGDTGPHLTFKNLIENPALLVGQKIGPYMIQEAVGSGGSGLVYRATHAALGQTVCIKIFYPLNNEGPDDFRNIARGVRGLAAMNHPFIIKVFDLEQLRLEDAFSLYLVMEFVRGQTLDQWSRSLAESDDAIALRMQMALNLTDALAAAHRCKYIDEVGFEQVGVLHGDIKPANIIVRENNSPVVLDFMMLDVQRLLDSRFVSGRVWNGDVITGAFGTPGFMAPEHERDGIVSARTDVYGLGLTLCHLFFPYAEQPALELIKQPGDERLSRLRELVVPMLGNPEARPKDMDEVANRLISIIEHQKAQASTVKDVRARRSRETKSKTTAPLKTLNETELSRSGDQRAPEENAAGSDGLSVGPSTAVPGAVPSGSTSASADKLGHKVQNNLMRGALASDATLQGSSQSIRDPRTSGLPGELTVATAPRSVGPFTQPPETTTRASTLTTLLFAFVGGIVFLSASVLFWWLCKLFPNRYFFYSPTEVTLRDTVIGVLCGITISELFRARRWSVARPHRIRAFIVHGATVALLSSFMLIPLNVSNLLHSDPPHYRAELGDSRFLTLIAWIYSRAAGMLMLAFIGFIVGLVICGLRVKGDEATSNKPTPKRRPRLGKVLLYSIAGAFVLFVMNQGLGRTEYWGLLTIRDTLFGGLLGITISEMRPSALWSIREGEQARAFLAHAAAGAAIAMVLSGAILRSTSSFYPKYLPFYFKGPMTLALFGFFVGAIIYLVRILRRTLRAGSTSVHHK